MKNIFKTSIAAITAMILSISLCFADDTPVENPVTMIQGTVTALQQKISANPNLNKNPTQLYAVVKAIVMPDVNIDQMAGLVLGPKWKSATPEQQQRFIDQFGLLLTKTYANALMAVSNYTVTLSPLRGNTWQTQQYVAVNGQVTSKTNGQSSNLTYYLERSGNSWKIYDLAVEGVSFLKNYQAQFQSFSNMDALNQKIDEMND